MRVADLIAYVNHDIDDATRAGLLQAGGSAARAGRRARRTRRRRASRTLVKDVVTETLAGGLTEIRMSDRVLDAVARSAELSVRRGLRERDRDRRVQEGDRHPERPLGEGPRAAGRVPRRGDRRKGGARRRHPRLHRRHDRPLRRPRCSSSSSSRSPGHRLRTELSAWDRSRSMTA